MHKHTATVSVQEIHCTTEVHTKTALVIYPELEAHGTGALVRTTVSTAELFTVAIAFTLDYCYKYGIEEGNERVIAVPEKAKYFGHAVLLRALEIVPRPSS